MSRAAVLSCCLLMVGCGIPAVPTTTVESDLNTRIAGHPFWKVKPPPAQASGLVEKIRSENLGSLVYVDDSFNCGVAKRGGAADVRQVIKDLGYGHYKPKGLGTRWICMDTFEAFSERPPAEAVASKLLSLLAAREYRD